MEKEKGAVPLFSELQLREDLEEWRTLDIFGPEFLHEIRTPEGHFMAPRRIDPAEIPFYMLGFKVEAVEAGSFKGWARQVVRMKAAGRTRPGGILRRYIVTEFTARVTADGMPAADVKAGWFNDPLVMGDHEGERRFNPYANS